MNIGQIATTKIWQLVYNFYSHAFQVAEAGYEWIVIGDITTATNLYESRHNRGPTAVRVCNTGNNWAFVRFGDETITPPTDGTDGIPVAPGTCVVLNSGEYTHIIADSTLGQGDSIYCQMAKDT